jgi:curved DNA-binding protein CbpA
MASGPAGKFQDHYKLLSVDPKADLDEIRNAHTRLVKLFHPNTGKDPNKEKYDAVNLALEVLTDPDARKIFDQLRTGANEDDQEIFFSGMKFFDDLPYEVSRRNTILCVLYDVRRQNPRVPTLTNRQLDKIVNLDETQVALALWYLKTLGYVLVDDKSKMQITALGVDFLQANPPDPATIFPFLKQQKRPEEKAQAVEAPKVVDPPPPAPVQEPPMPLPPPPPPEQSKPRPMSFLKRATVAVP